PFQKMLLLAPALKVRPYTLLLKAALPFLKVVRSIPLGGDQYEKYYRFHTGGAPREVYESFYQTYSFFQKNIPQSLTKTKAMVVCHPKDELIHHNKLEKWVRQKTPWSFKSISNSEADFQRYNHLCFDTQSLGTKSYQELLRSSEVFFNS
ncbi:MAG: hypothetical protein HRT44_06080, partial [Bdellovibrionales bacterium]|nr:hypothetical protein [Bdellovibrionales bacterium]NQZ18811.1 hypothetical protein [Bdellovibrionales bacterium]